jgi:hypothetical protein
MAFNILTNKYVLYTVLFLAITNVLGYLAMRDFESIILMIAVGALANHFNKNMIIVLSAAILASVIFKTTKRPAWPWYEKEGFKNKEGLEQKEEERKDINQEKQENMGVRTLQKLDKNLDNAAKKRNEYEAADESEEDLVETGNNKKDYADSMEDQINNLTNMLGNNNIKNIGKDTDDLVKKQNDLVDQMQNLGPMLKQAEDLLDKFEKSGAMRMAEKFAPMMEKFIPSGSKK